MTEMVERVATAMKLRASRPVGNLPSLEPALVGSLGDTWSYLAEAAIAALREPTEAMRDAGALPHRKSVADIWQAMIDAALKRSDS